MSTKLVDLEALAEELLALQPDPRRSITDAYEGFYDLMRRYGIKRGTQCYDEAGNPTSIEMNNFAWTLCARMFASLVQDACQEIELSLTTPDDLLV